MPEALLTVDAIVDSEIIAGIPIIKFGNSGFMIVDSTYQVNWHFLPENKDKHPQNEAEAKKHALMFISGFVSFLNWLPANRIDPTKELILRSETHSSMKNFLVRLLTEDNLRIDSLDLDYWRVDILVDRILSDNETLKNLYSEHNSNLEKQIYVKES